MVHGEWKPKGYEASPGDDFVRERTHFRDAVRRDPQATFPVEAGRYHLYVSYACPWAHRTLIVRALKGLQEAVGITVVDPHMGEDGWVLRPEDPGPVPGVEALGDLYCRASRDYTGRVTVPVLWDEVEQTIVNNESREIIRMLDHAFAPLATRDIDLAPPELVDRVDEVIDAIYDPINNGVYKCGFARTQAAYERAFAALFEALDHWDEVLGRQRWTCGEVLTEADVCLFTTLARFDLVYFGHFKCNLRHIYDYPHLWRFAKDLLTQPGVAETCVWEHMKVHYYWSHESLNPQRIVPVGPGRYLGHPMD